MKRGFTLVETLISLGVVVVIISLVVPAYIKINGRQRVTTSADKLKEAFLQAKDSAQSGKKDCTASACNCNQPGELSLVGWRVNIASAGSPVIYSYTVEGVCSTSPYPGSPTTFYSHTEKMPAGITVTAGANPVLFRVGGRGIYPPLVASSLITVTVADAGGNSCKFTVSGDGGIQAMSCP